MTHTIIMNITFILRRKQTPIELQSQNELVYPGIELNPETGQ